VGKWPINQMKRREAKQIVTIQAHTGRQNYFGQNDLSQKTGWKKCLLIFYKFDRAEKTKIPKGRMILRQNNCEIILPKNYSACLVPACLV